MSTPPLPWFLCGSIHAGDATEGQGGSIMHTPTTGPWINAINNVPGAYSLGITFAKNVFNTWVWVSMSTAVGERGCQNTSQSIKRRCLYRLLLFGIIILPNSGSDLSQISPSYSITDSLLQSLFIYATSEPHLPGYPPSPRVPLCQLLNVYLADFKYLTVKDTISPVLQAVL